MYHVRRFVVLSIVIFVLCGAWLWRPQAPTVTAQSRLSRSTMVAAGPYYSCAILIGGSLKCFGQNYVGQLGLGNATSYGNTADTVGAGLPTVDIGQTAKFVAAGHSNSTCAIRADDETVCWGNADNYMLGNGIRNVTVGDNSGEMGSALVPIQFGTSHAISLSMGDHSCALLASGDVKCWGYNAYGELGVNGNVQTLDQMGTNWPAVDLGSGRTAIAVTAGNNHTCAILDTLAVKCWGRNDYGQLGYGDITNRGYAALASAMPPVNLGAGRTAVAIAAGGYFTCAILDDGSLKCWGYNASGQLGQNATTTIGDGAGEMGDDLPPIYLGAGRTAVQVVASHRADLDYVCAILDNQTMKCWGENGSGQLGLGDDVAHGDEAGEMQSLVAVDLGSGEAPVQIAMGDMHTCVLLASTNIKCFGLGSHGQLANGTGNSIGNVAAYMGDALPLVDLDGVVATPTPTATWTSTATFTNTPTPTDTAIISKTPSKTYTRTKTPTRSKTKTKTKTPTKSKTPTHTPVGYVSRVAALASGMSHTCAVLASSEIKCWGLNTSGQLGVGDTNTRGDNTGEMANGLVGVDLGTGVLVKKIAAGIAHTCVLTTTNQVKCWGANGSGQLGLGDTNNRGDTSGEMGDALPFVELGAASTVTDLSLGDSFSCALFDSGAITCWGTNGWGQLGIGSGNTVGASTGQMGAALVSVDLGTGRTAVYIAARAYGVCAILDDASIKCWGDNRAGQIGLGDTTTRGNKVGEMGDNLLALPFAAYLTPIELSTGAYTTCARFDDGTVRCWGRNDYADLGTGDSGNRGDDAGEVAALLPINFGSGHTVKRIFGGKYSEFCALLDDDALKCWGYNSDANLGIGISSGDTKWGNAAGEMGDNLPIVNLGSGVTVSAVSGGIMFRCAILKYSTSVKCWGVNDAGQLGHESTYAAWGEYPASSMGDYLPIVRLGAIIPSTSTPTPTKTLTPSRTLSPSRTKSPTKTFTPSRTATRTTAP